VLSLCASNSASTGKMNKSHAHMPALWKGTNGADVYFHKSIIGIFVVYQSRIETDLLKLCAHPENSEWFSVISVIIFEVEIVAEQKQA